MKTYKQYLMEIDITRLPKAPDQDIEDRRSGYDAKKAHDDWITRTMDDVNKMPDSKKDPEGFKKYAEKKQSSMWKKNSDIQGSSRDPVTPDIPLGRNRQASLPTPSVPEPTQKVEPPKSSAPAPQKAEPQPKKKDKYLTSVYPNDALPPSKGPTKSYSTAELDKMFEQKVGFIRVVVKEMDLSREKPADPSDIIDKTKNPDKAKLGDRWMSFEPGRPGKQLTKGEIISINSPSKSDYIDLTTKK